MYEISNRYLSSSLGLHIALGNNFMTSREVSNDLHYLFRKS